MKKSTLIILLSELLAFILFIVGCSIIGATENEDVGAILMVISIILAIFSPIFTKLINAKIEYDKHPHTNDIKLCKKCGSSDISIQMISKNKNPGCLTIIIYIAIACTIIGIPIMIIYLLAKGKKTKVEKQCICQKCGYNWKIK